MLFFAEIVMLFVDDKKGERFTMELLQITTMKQAQDYLYETPKFTVKSTPEMTKRFYEYLGKPGAEKKIIHVAGTNGKGSVCTYLRNILTAHGKRTAMFTSPHLLTMRERFIVDGLMISEDDFLEVFQKVAKALEGIRTQKEMEAYHPSFFEYLFFMAMLWFEKKKAECIILETGLGGRLDATNVVENPALCIITKIGFDHMQYLGNTLEEIASEKAGIIKKNVPLIFNDFDKNITSILQKKAKSMNCETYSVGTAQIKNVKNHEKYIDFSFDCSYYKNVCLSELQIKIPTVAIYQMINASQAILASAVFLQEDWMAFKACNALATTTWPGRMEELKPNLFVDGAHNEDGIEAFIKTLKANQIENAILIFGVSADKDYEKMQKRLATELVWNQIIVVALQNERTAQTKQLRQQFERYTDVSVTEAGNVKDVLLSLYRNRNDKKIFVVGSLYLVGEVKELFVEDLL